MSRRDQEEVLVSEGTSLLEDLVRRSQQGDRGAMEGIYHRYKQPLFSLACRYTYDPIVAEDLLQEIFLKAFSHIGDVEDIRTFGGWIYRIALNTCFSYLRSKKPLSGRMVPLSEVEDKVVESSADPASFTERKPLEEAIQSLSPKLRNVFVLHDVQGFKHEEISGMLKCSVGTSKSQLFKARLKIRNHLQKKQAL